MTDNIERPAFSTANAALMELVKSARPYIEIGPAAPVFWQQS
ncbi:MAG: hypothetical protein ACYTGF_02485 [Planctomycetota bacterium]